MLRMLLTESGVRENKAAERKDSEQWPVKEKLLLTIETEKEHGYDRNYENKLMWMNEKVMIVFVFVADELIMLVNADMQNDTDS